MGADDFKMKAGFEPLEKLGPNGEDLPKETDAADADINQEEKPTDEIPEVKEEVKEEGEEVKAEENQEEKPETEIEEEKPTDEIPEVKEEKSSLNKISELTESQFESEEDLYEAYKNLNSKIEGKTLMESINAQVQEKYGDENLTFTDLVLVKSIDYDSMNELDLIESHLEFEDPDITEKEIKATMYDYELMKKSEAEISEMIENDEITQQDYDRIQAKTISRARVAKKALTEYQASINLDEFEIHTPGTPSVNAAPQKTEAEIQQELADYNAVIDGLEEVKLSVGTKESPFEFEIKVSDDDRNGIKNFCEAKDGKSFVDRRWMGEDGKVNMEVLSKDIYKIENYDRDVAVAFTQGKSEGVKGAIKENDNIELRDKGGSLQDVSLGKNIHAAVAKKIN